MNTSIMCKPSEVVALVSARTFARNFKLSAELVGMDYIQLKPIGCGKDLR